MGASKAEVRFRFLCRMVDLSGSITCPPDRVPRRYARQKAVLGHASVVAGLAPARFLCDKMRNNLFVYTKGTLLYETGAGSTTRLG